MIQSDNVDILTGIIFSNIALAVVPAAVKQGKFYLSPNAGPSQLAGKGCDPNYFNVAYQNDNQHEAAGEYSNTLGYKKTFILAPNYPAGKDSLNGFKRFYKGELAGELYTKLGQTDFAAEIAQIKASGADSVFFFLPGGMGISFVKQFVNSDTGLPLIGPGFSFDQDMLGAVGEAALGAHNTAQWSPDLDNQANKAFVDAFEAEYGRLPSVYASQGYDTAQLILSAHGRGRRRRPRRLPRRAQGRRLPLRPRQLQVRQQPAPDPELLRPRGHQARRRRHHQPHRRHRVREPRRRLRRRVPDAVTPRGAARGPATPAFRRKPAPAGAGTGRGATPMKLTPNNTEAMAAVSRAKATAHPLRSSPELPSSPIGQCRGGRGGPARAPLGRPSSRPGARAQGRRRPALGPSPRMRANGAQSADSPPRPRGT